MPDTSVSFRERPHLLPLEAELSNNNSGEVKGFLSRLNRNVTEQNYKKGKVKFGFGTVQHGLLTFNAERSKQVSDKVSEWVVDVVQNTDSLLYFKIKVRISSLAEMLKSLKEQIYGRASMLFTGSARSKVKSKMIIH